MAELVTKSDLVAAINLVETKIDNLSLQLTVRLGGLLAAGIVILAAIQKLT